MAGSEESSGKPRSRLSRIKIPASIPISTPTQAAISNIPTDDTNYHNSSSSVPRRLRHFKSRSWHVNDPLELSSSPTCYVDYGGDKNKREPRNTTLNDLSVSLSTDALDSENPNSAGPGTGSSNSTGSGSSRSGSAITTSSPRTPMADRSSRLSYDLEDSFWTSNISSADTSLSSPYILQTSADLQDIFTILAGKERRVLEARELLGVAEEDLNQFKLKWSNILGSPSQIMPIISRPAKESDAIDTTYDFLHRRKSSASPIFSPGSSSSQFGGPLHTTEGSTTLGEIRFYSGQEDEGFPASPNNPITVLTDFNNSSTDVFSFVHPSIEPHRISSFPSLEPKSRFRLFVTRISSFISRKLSYLNPFRWKLVLKSYPHDLPKLLHQPFNTNGSLCYSHCIKLYPHRYSMYA